MDSSSNLRRFKSTGRPVSRWHEQIGDPTLADGILDRLVHNAFDAQEPGQGEYVALPQQATAS
jgi:IstB-like ATP binding protein